MPIRDGRGTRRGRLRTAWFAPALVLSVACGSGDAPPPAAAGPGVTDAGSHAGRDGASGATSSGGSSGAGGSAGSAGTSGNAGLGGRASDAAAGSTPEGGALVDGADAATPEPEAGLCGDGVVGPHEFCDGTQLDNADCVVFGYSGGELRCDKFCTFDFSRCTGTELCFNGMDDDGDHAIDCADSDCATACAATCATATLVLDPGHVNGSTGGHASEIASSCVSAAGASGPEVVFRVKPSVTGVLEATVGSVGADFTLSVRADCSDAASELVCRNLGSGAGSTETVRVLVTRGKEVFLVIDGADPNQAGTFVLDLASRPIVCGDGKRDPGEECDDHNRDAGDGCSDSCKLELDEVEPNDTTTTATPYTELPFIGEISSPSDVDVFSVEIAAPGSMLTVQTLDLGDGACANLELDDLVEILAPDGHVIVKNDDAGPGFCAGASASSLSPGTYYVRVKASGSATSFPYNLDISRSP
jgi:cysteine-rich repeat protein